MKKTIILEKRSSQKGGQKGSQMWSAHRLSGEVKNAGIKPEKKKKKERI